MNAADLSPDLVYQRLQDLISIEQMKAISIGVSGGPDSMALCWLLSQSAYQGEIHALIVDHGLRDDSAEEAQTVFQALSELPRVQPSILTWDAEKPESRIMERARYARYDLLEKYCHTHEITSLLLAHHQDDQAETFLIRLSKGSGLNGLGGMRPVQTQGGIALVRPLLDVPKEQLINLCHTHHIQFVEDPSNINTDYMRPRLRQSRAVLEEEGLSTKRLAVTAQRLARARHALEELTQRAWRECLIEETENRVVLSSPKMLQNPDEIGIRVLLHAISQLVPGHDYGPRLEKVEGLFFRIKSNDKFYKETLAGCIFALQVENEALYIEKEH